MLGELTFILDVVNEEVFLITQSGYGGYHFCELVKVVDVLQVVQHFVKILLVWRAKRSFLFLE